MAVKGLTAAERAAARLIEKRKNRQKHFLDEIRTARNGRARYQTACQFAKAVADDLDDAKRTELAREIAEVAVRWNNAE